MLWPLCLCCDGADRALALLEVLRIDGELELVDALFKLVATGGRGGVGLQRHCEMCP